ncbi:MAG: UbiA family prenyltransferase [Saprospiraceae bacterium]
MINKFLFWLKVSRPGLWFATIWLYLLPTSQMDIWQSTPFWLGFLYITFPLNFLVYGWNDMVDLKTDALNPRKDSFLFGARGTAAQLEVLWKPMLIVQLFTVPYFIWLVGWKMLLLFTALFFVNWIYNLPERGLRSKPPFELFCQLGYLLIAPFSIFINDTSALPLLTYFYLFLFAIQSHLMGEVMDIEPDRAAGRKTTATILGMKKTKLIIIGVVLTEVLILTICFRELIFGGMLAIGLLWLILDLFIIYKTKRYTIQQMKLFGLLSNVVAIVSMAYVWYSACLLNVG